MKTEKIIILKNFINAHKDLSVQGSVEWLEERKYIIGGSEISSVIGKNPFSNLESLIAQKVNLASFNGNTACSWGNLFENVSEVLFKTLFVAAGDKIYTTGSIPHKTIKNHSYSPDGLCCIMFNADTPIFKTILLEFKSPYSSVPTTKVPAHYLPQVKAGLCTIDITEVAVFVNNMFRKCTLKQLDFTTNYDNRYHRDTDKKLKDIDMAIANGLILFSIPLSKLHIFTEKYEKTRTDIDTNIHNSDYAEFCDGSDSDPDSDSEQNEYFDNVSILYKIKKVIADKQNTMIDLGNETKELFDQFLKFYKDDNFIDIKCIKPQINKHAMQSNIKNLIIPDALNYVKSNDYLNNICKKYNSKKILAAFVEKCKNNHSIPIAHLPWKLLRSSHIIVEKDPEYLESIRDRIDSCIDIIRDINTNSKNMDDTANLFEKHFENNLFSKKYFDDKPHSAEFLSDFL
jgi:hypothetical protein